MAEKTPLKENKHEIFWNLINCALAGALVFFGAFVDGSITWTGVLAAFAAALIVFFTRFKDYWAKEESEYTTKIFHFVG